MTIALGVTIGSNAYIESITNVISGQLTQFDKNMMMNLRLPRMLVAAIAGACLAISGLVFQSILRNPLADPSIIGISSGAGVGALTIMYVFLHFLVSSYQLVHLLADYLQLELSSSSLGNQDLVQQLSL